MQALSMCNFVALLFAIGQEFGVTHSVSEIWCFANVGTLLLLDFSALQNIHSPTPPHFT